jgi:HlyD family secretion protein
MKRKIVWGSIILVVIVGVLAAFTRGGQEVQVIEIEKGELVKQVEEIGYVQAVEDYEIQASQTGRVTQVLIQTGDIVEKGQKLMVLENLDLDSEMSSINSQLEGLKAEINAGELTQNSTRLEFEIAEKDVARKEQLLSAGAISQAEYDNSLLNLTNIEKSLASQEAYINNLRSQLGNLNKVYQDINTKKQQLTVTSPIAGQILSMPVEKGQMAFAGTVLAQVGGSELMEIKTDILTDDLAEVKEGQKAYISASILGDEVLTGTVRKIYPQAHEKVSALGVIQRRVTVIIALDEPGILKPGYEIRVSIETMVKPDVVLVPRESVRIRDNGDCEVLEVVNDRVEYCAVEIGDKNQELYEVIEGLEPGDLIIHDAGNVIDEKTRVKPVKNPIKR